VQHDRVLNYLVIYVKYILETRGKMQTQLSIKTTVINNLLKELSVRDVSEIIKDSLVTEILCKISDFSDEVTHFEGKYGKSFNELYKEYEAGEEDFETYDDLMAWEFAEQGKQYWETKLNETKRVISRQESR